MNKYELALVVSAKIEDDARTATVEKAKEYITRAGGTVTEVEEWGKKKLAYDVQKMSEGFYYFIQFDAASDVPAKVEQDVRIMDNVLRFLCVRKDEADFHLQLTVASVVTMTSRQRISLTVLPLAEQQNFWRDSAARERSLFSKVVYRQAAIQTKMDSVFTRQML